MSKVYTKTGDKGQTGLVSGKRVLKSDQRIDLYGDLDDLNSRIGMSVSYLELDPKLKYLNVFLHTLQSAIFDLGSNLACEVENRAQFKLPQLTNSLIGDIEMAIDSMEKDLAPLKNFILPGGSIEASSLHLCRTSARSVERKLIGFHEATREELPVYSIEFLNRLSDYFFVLARHVTRLQGGSEIPWKPRQ